MTTMQSTHCDDVAERTIGPDTALQARIDRALQSTPMRAVRALLDPLRLHVEPAPIVQKYLSRQYLRLMFPVSGGIIELGTVASIVCLYDCNSESTLYAHPMHAGPDVNPLLKHPDGPMAFPKAQPGQDGDRATTRLIEHKKALWQRFLLDTNRMGVERASARWRNGYYWALKRLYFCTRCPCCRWGSPFLDGPDPAIKPKPSLLPPSPNVPEPEPAPAPAFVQPLDVVLSSDVWKIEKSYARRGGFVVSETPRIMKKLNSGLLQYIFPTNALLIQGGTIVALSVVYSAQQKKTLLAHCLSAGPDPEIQFLSGDRALGIPLPGGDDAAARARYASWRRDAWTRFWLDELDHGIAHASTQWLRGLWQALEALFGGNDCAPPPRRTNVDAPMTQATPSRRRKWQGETLSHTIARYAPHRSPPAANDNGASKESPTASDPHGDLTPAVPFDSLQNTGRRCFAGHAACGEFTQLRPIELSAMSVNLGRRCNQSCSHCHVDAGPHRTEQMSGETVDLVVDLLKRHKFDTLDITGGAPEMHPRFRFLAAAASNLCRRVIDRCNLTILLDPGQEDLARFLADHEIEIAASLPNCHAEPVDRQRGRGVFDKSIEALRRLNALGYGRPGTRRILNLVFNPAGTDLAPRQEQLEARFKQELRDRFGIAFNHLFAMNNMPVNRFRDVLAREARLEAYMEQLVAAFNPATLGGLMCRHSISVGWDGRLYDCDFNQAARLPLQAEPDHHIRDFNPSRIAERNINTTAHCFGCAAGFGSSCGGALSTRYTGPPDARKHRAQPAVG